MGFAVATFLGSFLLFLVQPLIGRLILPWFGSTPSVWATCLVVFQSLLLAGYAYAYVLDRSGDAHVQGRIHVIVAVLAAVVLPILPDPVWARGLGVEPTGRIALLLVCTIGLPFAVLAGGGPILQRWFAHARPSQSPYRLYALSNLGSMLALLAYPALIEPHLPLMDQARVWSGLYVLYAAIIIACAGQVWRLGRREPVRARVRARRVARVGVGRMVLWVGLSAAGSALLLSTTNQLCQDVAVVPFLWIVPLALYLLTFVICFERERWYARSVFHAALPVAMAVACLVLLFGIDLEVGWQLVGYGLVLFVGCMLCHGELARLKPMAASLTAYYLAIALGGAVGGILVGIVAPLALPELWEYHLSLIACYAIVLVAVHAQHPRSMDRAGLAVWVVGFVAFSLVIAGSARGWTLERDDETNEFYLRTGTPNVLAKRRGFFGVVRVVSSGLPGETAEFRSLEHGRILHGGQFVHPHHRWRPTTYYGPESGVGYAMRLHPKRARGGPLRVGVVGLGVGTLASYAKQGDVFRAYEINLDVVELAYTYFTYLTDAADRGADVEIMLGDARLMLENQLLIEQRQGFDVLAVDAFSSDAIPIHLLTRECFALYRAHLAEGGIIAINISNRFIDLLPVVFGLASDAGMHAVAFDGGDDESKRLDSSDWVLISVNEDFLEVDEIAFDSSDELLDGSQTVLWTDDFSSVFGLLITE